MGHEVKLTGKAQTHLGSELMCAELKSGCLKMLSPLPAPIYSRISLGSLDEFLHLRGRSARGGVFLARSQHLSFAEMMLPRIRTPGGATLEFGGHGKA